jgi:hypothetical protein
LRGFDIQIAADSVAFKGFDMTKMSNKIAHQSAINLIEEQLQVLPVAMATILQPTAPEAISSDLLDSLVQLQSSRHKQATGSGGNIVAHAAKPDLPLNICASIRTLHDNPLQKLNYLRVIVSNALLAVGMFFREHEMADMRTPEIQFFDHVCDAILNGNKFDIEPGYIPISTFAGLVINSELNGKLLFGDGVTPGFMEFGDGIALLRWLSRYLRGENNFVSAGDAG